MMMNCSTGTIAEVEEPSQSSSYLQHLPLKKPRTGLGKGFEI